MNLQPTNLGSNQGARLIGKLCRQPGIHSPNELMSLERETADIRDQLFPLKVTTGLLLGTWQYL